MLAKEIQNQLENIASAQDFIISSADLVERWRSMGVGVDAMEPILRFMEKHPFIDYGMPGPLVHFVEQFYEKGYEEELIESINRKPTSSTAWMLNRIINGTKLVYKRQLLIAALEQARFNPLTDQTARQRINQFLERLSA